MTITLNDEVDISRGDVLVAEDSNVKIGHRFLSTLLWMSEDPFVPGKSYWIKTRAKLLSGVMDTPTYKLNVNTLEKCEATTLVLNEIGQCVCEFDQDIAFESYEDNPHLGSFIIIDRQTNNTVGMGLIDHAIGNENWAERYVSERNKVWSRGQVTLNDRFQKNRHHPLLLVLTGNVPREIYFEVGTWLEKTLVDLDIQAYRYGFQFLRMADADVGAIADLREDMFRQLFDVAYSFMDAGLVFISSIRGLTKKEADQLKAISDPFDVLIIDLEKESSVSDVLYDNTSESKDRLISRIRDQIS